jgi:hypothetical protein
LQGDDGSVSQEAGSSDGGTVVLLDSGLDQGSLDVEEIDTTVVRLDAEVDVELLDVSRDTESYDVATNPIPCPSVAMPTSGAGGGTTGFFATTGNYCFATCDDITGWNGSNLDGRTLLLVNGQSVPVPSGSNGTMPLPTPKVFGTYTVFQINGGDRDYASIQWWGTPHTCSAPDGGFGLQ